MVDHTCRAFTAPRAAPRPPTRSSSRDQELATFSIDFSPPPMDTAADTLGLPPIAARSSSLLPAQATLPAVKLPSRFSDLFTRRKMNTASVPTVESSVSEIDLAPLPHQASCQYAHFGSSRQRQRRQHRLLTPDAPALESLPQLSSQFPLPPDRIFETASPSPSVESEDIRTPTFEFPSPLKTPSSFKAQQAPCKFKPFMPSRPYLQTNTFASASTPALHSAYSQAIPKAAVFRAAPPVPDTLILSVDFTACSERLASTSFTTVHDIRQAVKDAENMCIEARASRPSSSRTSSAIDITMSSSSSASSVHSRPSSTSSHKLKRKPVPAYKLPASVKIVDLPPRPRVRTSSIDLGPPTPAPKKSLYGNLLGSLSMMDLTRSHRPPPEPTRRTIAEWAEQVGVQTKEARVQKGWKRMLRMK